MNACYLVEIVRYSCCYIYVIFCNSPTIRLDQCKKKSQDILLIEEFVFSTKNSAEFRLYLGHLKLSTTNNLLNQPIIIRSHNSKPYIKHHNSTPHIILTIYIYPTSKFNMNIAHISYYKI